MSNIKKNFIYNLLYRLLLMILPLITAPYISRVMGAKNLGIFSYNYSIVQYFMLFALLGIENYGVRTISKCKDNEEELSKQFYSLYFFQLIFSSFILIAYILYLFFLKKTDIDISILMIFYLISTCFDVSWLLFGLEKFKLTITKNIVVKIVSIIFIFSFVNDSSDLIIYTIIMSLTTLITQICLWPYVIKKIKFSKPTIKSIISHIKPNFVLFVPVIAVSLYKIMDKIMLGLLSTMTEVGLYESAEKIINMPITFISALGTVMLPRISNLAIKQENEKISKYIETSIQFIMFITIPITLGLVAIGKNFAIIFYGPEFEKAGTIIMCLAITLPFVAWANVIRTQILIPKEKDNVYIKSVIIGAILNIIFNLILIKQLGAIGAAIGTIIAEISVMLYQTSYVKKEINLKNWISYSAEFTIKGIIMFLLLLTLNNFIKEKVILTLIQIILGIIIYTLLNKKYILKYIQKIFKK